MKRRVSTREFNRFTEELAGPLNCSGTLASAIWRTIQRSENEMVADLQPAKSRMKSRHPCKGSGFGMKVDKKGDPTPAQAAGLSGLSQARGPRLAVDISS